MPGTKIDCRVGQVDTPATRDDELIGRAAKRTDWAGAALEGAAGDLNNAHGSEGGPLTGLAEVVLEEAARVSHLAEDIQSHKSVEGAGPPGGGA